jgi:hypothetical protein
MSRTKMRKFLIDGFRLIRHLITEKILWRLIKQFRAEYTMLFLSLITKRFWKLPFASVVRIRSGLRLIKDDAETKASFSFEHNVWVQSA